RYHSVYQGRGGLVPVNPSALETDLSRDVKSIVLSPTIFKHFRCPPECSVCCQHFTLDYLPSEMADVPHPEGFAERVITVNGKPKTVFTNDQNGTPICDFLSIKRPGGGLGCAQFKFAPLACISAPQLQFWWHEEEGKTVVTKRGYGRGWAMKPHPAKCE